MKLTPSGHAEVRRAPVLRYPRAENTSASGPRCAEPPKANVQSPDPAHRRLLLGLAVLMRVFNDVNVRHGNQPFGDHAVQYR